MSSSSERAEALTLCLSLILGTPRSEGVVKRKRRYRNILGNWESPDELRHIESFTGSRAILKRLDRSRGKRGDRGRTPRGIGQTTSVCVDSNAEPTTAQRFSVSHFSSQNTVRGVSILKANKSSWRFVMSKLWMRVVVSAALVAGLVFAGWVAVSDVEAQGSLTGTWTASVSKDAKDTSKINLNFERSSKNGRSNMGQNYDFSDLQGLTREQALNGGPVNFSLVREAGRIDCEGSFQNGKGSGTFRFTGNAAFVSAMKSRGFDFAEDLNANDDDRHGENRLFAATTLNVTTALADDLVAAGFTKLRTDDLFKAAIFKVDSKFAREMKASGFENLGMEELVKARIFKIDADFVRQVSQMGYAKEPFESLVKMQIFKVTPEFLTEMRAEGLTNLQLEDAVKLRIFKIDTEFIRQAKSEGVPMEVEKLVQRKIGVYSIRSNQ
jgi:hypothetical protein